MDSKMASVTRGAPNNPPQNVLAIGVAGRDAVRNQEAYRARVIGDRSKGNVAFLAVLPVTGRRLPTSLYDVARFS